MKKQFLILISLFVIANSNFAQNSLDWRLGTQFSNYKKLNIFSSNNQLNPINSIVGADFDMTVNIGKNMGQIGAVLGFNTKSEGDFLTNLNSFSGNLFLGRHVPIYDGYAANFLLGYSCQSIQISGYHKKGQDFNTLLVSNSSGMLQLQNVAHCISFKVENVFLSNKLILSFSYNYSLTNNKWEPLYGNLLNAPTDNLSSIVMSLKYSILGRKF